LRGGGLQAREEAVAHFVARGARRMGAEVEAYVIFIVVIGGIGTKEGPIIGVLIFYLPQYYLAALGSWYLMLLGGLAIILMLFAPTGVWGLISHVFDVSLFPVRRRLIVRPKVAAGEQGGNP
jgi:branched-chain amino acid transport system permease protein